MNTMPPTKNQPITQPDEAASLQEWVDWFYRSFLPHWIARAQDPQGFGFYDLLDDTGAPAQHDKRTLLAQSRLLFTFSHLALKSGDQKFYEAAEHAREALRAFEKAPGRYSRARTAEKQATNNPEDNLALSYDQSFVLLGLSTWGRLSSDSHANADLETCWLAIENHLFDKATGLLLEYDELPNPGQPNAPKRAQNPHMHLYEAALQTYEMTNHRIWLERAGRIRSKGLEYFYDQDSGTITEFLTPNLNELAARDGQRREIGHQCEWAWLLYREIELAGDCTLTDLAGERSTKTIADALLAFADNHGFASTGPLQGAALDAVSANTDWQEDTFLLWPQTEAIKTYAIRKENPEYAASARHLMLLVFKQYFANHAMFVNQLDATGKPLWTDALSRLLYHLVLALTEGDRAGLWKTPTTNEC